MTPGYPLPLPFNDKSSASDNVIGPFLSESPIIPGAIRPGTWTVIV